MERSLTGSILLGFGVLSYILAQWANIAAFSTSVLLDAVILGMILTGAILVVVDIRNEVRDVSTEDITAE